MVSKKIISSLLTSILILGSFSCMNSASARCPHAGEDNSSLIDDILPVAGSAVTSGHGIGSVATAGIALGGISAASIGMAMVMDAKDKSPLLKLFNRVETSDDFLTYDKRDLNAVVSNKKDYPLFAAITDNSSVAYMDSGYKKVKLFSNHIEKRGVIDNDLLFFATDTSLPRHTAHVYTLRLPEEVVKSHKRYDADVYISYRPTDNNDKLGMMVVNDTDVVKVAKKVTFEETAKSKLIPVKVFSRYGNCKELLRKQISISNKHKPILLAVAYDGNPKIQNPDISTELGTYSVLVKVRQR